MNCKYCNVPLEDGTTVCPVCGKDLATEDAALQMPALEMDDAGEPIAVEEITQEPELTAYTQTTIGEAMSEKPKTQKSVIFLCVLGVIFSAVLIVGSVIGILFALDILPLRENNIFYRDNYSVSDDKVIRNADKVVATVLDKTLTNGQLQMYYWFNVSDYLYENQYTLSSKGLDYTKPLNEQKYYADTSKTWQQAFLEAAIDYWHRYTVLYEMAMEAGYQLDEELQNNLDSLAEDMKTTAVQYGYSSVDEMLRTELGPTTTIEMYVDYMRVYYTGMSYFTEIYNAINPTVEEIEAYFAENETLLSREGVTKETGLLVDVRHILIEPEDTDGDKTISEDEWEACRQKAQGLLDQYLAGDKTEASFAALANAHSTDPGSNTNGGLYEDVYQGYMVKEFDAWLFDEGRQKFDTGLVKTTYGYHVMFYSDNEEIWVYVCRESIREEKSTQVLKEQIELNKVEINYKNIYLSVVSMG